MKYHILIVILSLVINSCCGQNDYPANTEVIASVDWVNLEAELRRYNNPSEHLAVEIGRKSGESSASLDLIKWPENTDSVYFSIDLGANPEQISFSGDTTLIDYPVFDAKFYFLNDSKLEWEVVVYSKPPQPQVTFDIDFSNLTFFYQDSIYKENPGDDFKHGSYAVYHSYKGRSYYIPESDSLFRTGKAFHIDRMKAWDNLGDTTWLDLQIDTVNMIITLSGEESWFNDADYPIVIDPTFGYTSVAANTTTMPGRTISHIGDAYTATTGDIVTSIHIYGSATSTTLLYGGIYTFVSNDTDEKTGTEGSLSLSAGSIQWHEIPVNIALSNGVTYVVAGANDNGLFTVYYDSNAGDNNEKDYDNIMPANFSVESTSGAAYSFYATYTTGGSESNPFIRPRRLKKGVFAYAETINIFDHLAIILAGIR